MVVNLQPFVSERDKSGVARIVLRIKLIIIDSALARMRTINSWAELLDLFGSAQSSH